MHPHVLPIPSLHTLPSATCMVTNFSGLWALQRFTKLCWNESCCCDMFGTDRSGSRCVRSLERFESPIIELQNSIQWRRVDTALPTALERRDGASHCRWWRPLHTTPTNHSPSSDTRCKAERLMEDIDDSDRFYGGTSSLSHNLTHEHAPIRQGQQTTYMLT